jgi:hypothetical protein
MRTSDVQQSFPFIASLYSVGCDGSFQRAGKDIAERPGETLTGRFTSVEDGMNLYVYWTTKCAGCLLKSRCTSGKECRISAGNMRL